jgi:O-antigen/teichoic acid export membrane protein
MSFGRVTTLLLLSRTASYVLALLNSILLARILGAERLGEYAYAMGVAAVFGLVPNLGISTVVTRTVARNPTEVCGMIRAAMCAQIMLGVLVLVLIVGFAALLPSQTVPLLYVSLAAGQLAVGSLSWPYLALLSGRGRYDLVGYVELAGSLISTVFLTTAIVLSGTVMTALCSHVLAAIGAVLLARLVAAPQIGVRTTELISVRSLLREALPFGATAAVQGLYTRVDILLLGQIATTLLVGLYSAAYKPITLVVYLGGTVAGALLPFLTQSPGQLPPVFGRILRVLTTVAPALALLLSGLAGPVLSVLYGPDFRDAAPILAVLAWSVVANWLYAPFSVALQAIGRERGWLYLLTAGLALNVIGNVVGIPRWGAVGAAGATLLSETVLLIGALVLMPSVFEKTAVIRNLLATMGAAGAAAATLWLGVAAGWGAVMATGAALIVYAVLLTVARQLTSEDAAAVVGWIRQGVWDGSRG